MLSRLSVAGLVPLCSAARTFCTVANTDAEKSIASKLMSGLKAAKRVEVQDTSGGCGAMYRIVVVAEDFK